MQQTIPWLLLVLAAGCLLGAIYALFRSLLAAFGAGSVDLGSLEFAGSDQRRALLLEKDALLRSLKDLEFERDAGKIAPEDFGRIERRLRARAKEVLVLLDREAAPYRSDAEALLSKHLGEGVPAAESPATAAIEAPAPATVPPPAPATAATEAPATVPPPAPAATEAPATASPPAIAAPTCARCGAANDPDAVFCKKCGAKLGGSPAEETSS